MGDLHVVPLARQAVVILRELRALSGWGEYVFPSLLTLERPMSNNTVNTALRRLGYTKEQMTGHGFRSMASTLLNEQGFHPDLIKLQLAHVDVGGLPRLTAHRKGNQHTTTRHLITPRATRIISPRADIPIRAKHTAANNGTQRSDHD